MIFFVKSELCHALSGRLTASAPCLISLQFSVSSSKASSGLEGIGSLPILLLDVLRQRVASFSLHLFPCTSESPVLCLPSQIHRQTDSRRHAKSRQHSFTDTISLIHYARLETFTISGSSISKTPRLRTRSFCAGLTISTLYMRNIVVTAL